MKLNPDCMREILLYLEEELSIDLSEKKFKTISLLELKNKFKSDYTEEDIWYSVYNLQEVQFIEGKIQDIGKHKMAICDIGNITWNGHQFLNDIRPKTIWNATKDGAQKIGNMSIRTLSFIASEITKKIITSPEIITSIIEKMGQ